MLDLQAARHHLHQFPELSNAERLTADWVEQQLAALVPDQLYNGLGGTGVAAVFDSGRAGPTVLFRCELDALPIQEQANHEHPSRHPGIAHLCGHDGHMTILLALAEAFTARRPQTGRAILLFQPAEETGAGAHQVVADERFSELRPDYAFALHNVPGLPLGEVAIKSGPFNCASRGLILELKGRTSHAAHPEDGLNPAPALAQLIQQLQSLPESLPDFSQITLVGARLGERAFGTAAGDAELMATLRTETNTAMDALVRRATTLAEQIAAEAGLELSVAFEDVFDATINSPAGTQAVIAACDAQRIPVRELDHAFRWSEDFGALLAASGEGALFALGAGEDHPQLHRPDYDFPDALVPIGRRIFRDLADRLLDGL
ncbi:amidohydrolase [Marinobacteraceae bacterium S3BR75-40.1]